MKIIKVKTQTKKDDIEKSRFLKCIEEINKKYPIIFGSGQRARLYKKTNGPFFIECWVPYREYHEKGMNESQFAPIIKKHFPNEKIRMYEGGRDDFEYRFYIMESDYKRPKYEPSKVDREKVKQAVQEINRKFPMASKIIKRAGWGEKKGQVFIVCEIPIMEYRSGKYEKQVFLPIIKKYFPNEKIKPTEGYHMDRGFEWVDYYFHILEK